MEYKIEITITKVLTINAINDVEALLIAEWEVEDSDIVGDKVDIKILSQKHVEGHHS